MSNLEQAEGGSEPAAEPSSTFHVSLEELAARTNLSPLTISRVETGKRTTSLDVLRPLATALQGHLDELLTHTATSTW